MCLLTTDERAWIIAAWAHRTALENRRRRIGHMIDIMSFAIGFAGVCYMVARGAGWL